MITCYMIGAALYLIAAMGIFWSFCVAGFISEGHKQTDDEICKAFLAIFLLSTIILLSACVWPLSIFAIVCLIVGWLIYAMSK